MIVSRSFYLENNVVALSQKLLGKYLMTKTEGVVTGGMIREVEAYAGPEDKASHAYQNRKTKRNEVMFDKGGVAYVYLCYGIHTLFNVVTNAENIPHAILVRAIKPLVGIEVMCKRRKKQKLDKTLTSGPGSVCQALGITRVHNGEPLTGSTLWIEDRGVYPKKEEIISSARIGISYAEEYVHVPWRFQYND
jgi:DNA-3-methyladenine glycosylase